MNKNLKPPRPPMPIPGAMQLPVGTVRWIAFEWMGQGWSVCDLIETQRRDHQAAHRYMRGTARKIVSSGGHAFVWAVCGDMTKEIVL